MANNPPDYVTLMSSDGYSFIVRRSSACISDAIKHGFRESQTNVCYFDNITGLVLEKVCEYFYYHEKNKDAQDVPDMEGLPPELALELLMAADYLNI